MKQPFGPWSTAINTGNNPQLSSFWKRRMTLLPRLVHGRMSLSPGDRLHLCAVAILVLVMPLFSITESSTAQANGQQGNENKKIRGLLIGWNKLIDKKVVTILQEVSPDSLKTSLILKTDRPINSLRISPDGKSVAYEANAYVWVGNLEGKAKRVFDLDPTGKHRIPKKIVYENGRRKILKGTDTTLTATVSWSPDSREVVVSRRAVTNREVIVNRKQGIWGLDQKWAYETSRVNLDSGKQTPLKLNFDQYVSDWSPDGKRLLVITGLVDSQIDLVDIDGRQPRRLSGAGYHNLARFSPDGKRILFAYGGKEYPSGMYSMDLNGKNLKAVFVLLDASIQTACWSPDSLQVVLTMSINKPVFTKDGRRGLTYGGSRTYLVKEDGKNAREIPLPDGVTPGLLDWR